MLEAVVQSSPLGLAVLDLEGKVRLWNPAAERMTGWAREETVGRPLRVVPPEDADVALMVAQRIFSGQSITDQEHQSRRKDCTVFPVSISGAPLHNAAW